MISKLFQWQSSGLKDWLWQRISACVFILYASIITIFWYVNPNADLIQWRTLVYNPYMQILGFAALFSMLLHAWIGLWVVISDYIKPMILSKLAIMVVLLLITVYLFAGIKILWGV